MQKPVCSIVTLSHVTRIVLMHFLIKLIFVENCIILHLWRLKQEDGSNTYRPPKTLKWIYLTCFHFIVLSDKVNHNVKDALGPLPPGSNVVNWFARTSTILGSDSTLRRRIAIWISDVRSNISRRRTVLIGICIFRCYVKCFFDNVVVICAEYCSETFLCYIY